MACCLGRADGGVRRRGSVWGVSGVFTSAAVLGLTDVDALTVSMAKMWRRYSPAVAATAIAVGVLANTGLKLGLACSSAAGRSE